MEDFTHIYDWMSEPTEDPVILQVQEWFREFSKPAVHQNRGYLFSRKLTCQYKGELFRCIGCSRMGDVWLTRCMDVTHGYDLRVDVALCSDWNIEST